MLKNHTIHCLLLIMFLFYTLGKPGFVSVKVIDVVCREITFAAGCMDCCYSESRGKQSVHAVLSVS